MSSVRLRRLMADFEKLRDYVSRHPRLQLIQAEGSPPERYQIEYRITSLRQKAGHLEEVTSHLVEVALPRDYPRVPPQCRMLTPVFHPNIAPHAICIGDHWSAGESLSALVARIGEMLAYQSYNTRSPLNGEAARWTDQNIARLPLDPVSMATEEPRVQAGQTTATPPSVPTQPSVPTPPSVPTQPFVPTQPSAAAQPSAASPEGVTVHVCQGCSARLRLSSKMAGQRVRCPKCSTIVEVPPFL